MSLYSSTQLRLREHQLFLALTIVVGVLAGLSAVLFTVAIDWATRFLFGLDPLYWPVKVFWLVEAKAVNAWVYLAIAIIVQIFVLRLLLQRMNHRVTP